MPERHVLFGENTVKIKRYITIVNPVSILFLDEPTRISGTSNFRKVDIELRVPATPRHKILDAAVVEAKQYDTTITATSDIYSLDDELVVRVRRNAISADRSVAIKAGILTAGVWNDDGFWNDAAGWNDGE